MVILIDGVKYILRTPDSEDMLERIIEKNYRYIFGKNSFYFNCKRKIKSRSAIGSIPDAYLLIFDPQPKWCILEVELASHPLYEHIIPQLTKFNRGIENISSRKLIIDMFYEEIKADPILEAKIKKRIESSEIYKFISELISTQPMIIIAIDERTGELEEAIRDIRENVKILEFKSFRREGISEEIEAYLFNPPVHLKRKEISPDKTITLQEGLKLHKEYNGKMYTAEVVKGEKIKVGGKTYNSPSSAAVAVIQSTGSKRKTEDGWRFWKYKDPKTGEEKLLDELRKIVV
ncbi:hypothetical protein ES702_02551 [subsurface metagenome]